MDLMINKTRIVKGCAFVGQTIAVTLALNAISPDIKQIQSNGLANLARIDGYSLTKQSSLRNEKDACEKAGGKLEYHSIDSSFPITLGDFFLLRKIEELYVIRCDVPN